ncbi:MAG: nucleotidyltransferase domain-containing protein [Syntrophomonadaceae bacterium]|nr:nucleotidyltransferase domain-containing protein [Syntrophomonadaceae bacterium]
MNFGLSEKSIAMIIQGLSRWEEIQEAAIFGSRATGTYKKGSDVDLVIYGPQITPEIVSHLSTLLNEELPLPYYFDIVHYQSIKNASLKNQIDTYGIQLWDRDFAHTPSKPYLS